MATDQLIACHDCDRLYERKPLRHREVARCSRCGSVLYRQTRDVADRTLAWALASLVLFIVANTFPFLEFKIAGRVQVSHLATGVTTLYSEGYWELAAMVAFTSILAPLTLIVGLLLLMLPVRLGRPLPHLNPVCKLVTRVKQWSMMEVFLLGVIVTIIKLSAMADIVIGPACWAFGALIFASTAAVGAFEPDVVWELVESEA